MRSGFAVHFIATRGTLPPRCSYQPPIPCAGVVGDDSFALQMLLRMTKTALPRPAVRYALDEEVPAVIAQSGQQRSHFLLHLFQQPSHRRDARRAQPVDHQSLEQRRETRARVRPGHADRPRPMLRATHPRHVHGEDRPVLARRQMPPTTTTRVVAARRAPAGRTTVRLALAPSHEHLHLAGLKPQLDARHLPRTPDTQNPTVQVCVAHHARLRHTHHEPGRAPGVLTTASLALASPVALRRRRRRRRVPVCPRLRWGSGCTWYHCLAGTNYWAAYRQSVPQVQCDGTTWRASWLCAILSVVLSCVRGDL